EQVACRVVPGLSRNPGVLIGACFDMGEASDVGVGFAPNPERAVLDVPARAVHAEVDSPAEGAVATAGQLGIDGAVAIQDAPAPEAAEVGAAEARVVAVGREFELVDGQLAVV